MQVPVIFDKPRKPRSPLLNNLAAYYKAEEASGTLIDVLGVSTLTDTNTVTSNPGKVGNARQYTRANSEFHSVADSAALSMGATDMTIACWAYLDSLPAGSFCALVSKCAVGTSWEYQLFYRNDLNTFSGQVSPDGGAVNLVTVSHTLNPSLSTWYFVVLQADLTGDLMSVNVNNGTPATGAYTGAAIFDGTNAFTIGVAGVVGWYMDGRIDEVGIWKRLLTAAELTTLYNGGNGRTYPFDEVACADSC